MANINRYEPLGDVFDDLLKGFFVRPVSAAAMEQADVARRAKIEVSEQKDSYKVHAELPGVKKEDIKIEIDGDQVSLSAETKAEREDKDGERVIHSERYYGRVARTFRLGAEIDESKANAKYENGILELTLPKRVGTSSKQITVQ
jgi:HSP20 family protein